MLGGGVAQLGEPLRAAVRAALREQAASSPFLASLDLADRLASCRPTIRSRPSAPRCWAAMTDVPGSGLIDLQVNGAAGIDLTAEPDRLWEVAAALPAYGVTAFLPTVITADPAARERPWPTSRPARPRAGPAPCRSGCTSRDR